MVTRAFERSTIAAESGPRIPAYLIRCSKCGETEKISSNTRGGGMAPEGVAQRFRNKGWSISTRGNADLCPKCQQRKSSPVRETPVAELTIVAEPPREMGKEDRRVIFAKINDVYLDERSGYSKGWNDAKVAQDLGVPVAWARSVRAEHFGKEGDEEGEKLKSLVKQVRQQLDSAVVPADRLNRRLKAAKAVLERFSNDADETHFRICEIDSRLRAIEEIVCGATNE